MYKARYTTYPHNINAISLVKSYISYYHFVGEMCFFKASFFSRLFVNTSVGIHENIEETKKKYLIRTYVKYSYMNSFQLSALILINQFV